jgi:hypothetical protein
MLLRLRRQHTMANLNPNMTVTVRAGDGGKLASAKSQQMGPCPDGLGPNTL